MQESQLYTGIPKWRERLGIEPGQLSTIPAFRGLRDHIVTKLVTENHFFRYTYIITPVLNVYKQKNPRLWGLMFKISRI